MVEKYFNKKLALKEQAKLLKILGELLYKGYPLIHAIEFLTIHFPKKFRNLLDESKELLISGENFIEFIKHLNIHPDVIVYLHYAEKHGDLAFALKEGSFILTKKIQHRANLRKVIGYPIFLLSFLLLILLIFRNFIIPQYELLFYTFQTDHHSFAFTYIQFIKQLPYLIFLFLIISMLCLTCYLLYIKKLSPIKQMEKLVKLPFIKKFLILMNTYEFSMQLSIMLHAGFPLVDALSTMQSNDSRTFLREKSMFFYEQIRSGISLQQVLKNDITFHFDLVYVIDHGMKNSTLVKELADYAEHIKNYIEDGFKRSLQIIQPIFLMIISISIISIYIAILYPMFQLMKYF